MNLLLKGENAQWIVNSELWIWNFIPTFLFQNYSWGNGNMSISVYEPNSNLDNSTGLLLPTILHHRVYEPPSGRSAYQVYQGHMSK